MELNNNTGSRNQNGNVPNVNWNADDQRVRVNYFDPGYRNDNLRARSEVSVAREF